MAREVFREKVLNLVHDLVMLEYRFAVGASGAVGTLTTSGVDSVEKVGTGIYKINLEKTYNRLLGAQHGITAGAGSEVAATGIAVGDVCRIVSVGTTDFTETAGSPNNDLKTIFVGAATGVTGTGTIVKYGICDAVSVQVLSEDLAPVDHLHIQCISDAGAIVNPDSGSVINGLLMLRRGSIKGDGE